MKRIPSILVAASLSVIGVMCEAPVTVDATDPANLDNIITSEFKKQRLHGMAYAAVYGDSLVVSSGKGYADVEQKRPFTDDTRMMIASISKTMIVTSIMQLYEQGLLGLDDDVGNHLPFSVRNPCHPDDPITIRMLLTHTSTITDYGYNTFYLWGSIDYPVPLMRFERELLTPGGEYYVKKQFSDKKPGQEYSYSNYGAALLACVVEHITGMDYAVYCNEHIFKPLGMTQSTFFYKDTPASELAMCYSANGCPHQYSWPSYPDGHLMTTVKDLSRFMAAYIQGGTYKGYQLLKPATLELIFGDYTSSPGIEKQGLIFYRITLAGKHLWGHNGGDEGIATDMYFDRSKKTGYIFFTNRSGATSETIGTALINYAERE